MPLKILAIFPIQVCARILVHKILIYAKECTVGGYEAKSLEVALAK